MLSSHSPAVARACRGNGQALARAKRGKARQATVSTSRLTSATTTFGYRRAFPSSTEARTLTGVGGRVTVTKPVVRRVAGYTASGGQGSTARVHGCTIVT